MYPYMILNVLNHLPPPSGTPKYYIGGDEVLEIPVSFRYCRRDSIQANTLWFSEKKQAPTGTIIFGYHVNERYIKRTESAGSLPDGYFYKMRLTLVIT